MTLYDHHLGCIVGMYDIYSDEEDFFATQAQGLLKKFTSQMQAIQASKT